jgi:hypothetical protein
MKNVLRLIVSIIALSSFAVSQLPETGNCQMAYGAFFAAGCRMPCCKTNLPMPNCPFLKTAAPRDLVAYSAPIFEVGLAPLRFAQTIVLPQPRFWTAIVSEFTDTIELLFIGPPQAVRAPPTNVHLLAA